MWDLVGNPEDRFSHNEAHIRKFRKKQRILAIDQSVEEEISCIFDDTCI